MTIPKLAQQLYFDTPEQEDEEVLPVETIQNRVLYHRNKTTKALKKNK